MFVKLYVIWTRGDCLACSSSAKRQSCNFCSIEEKCSHTMLSWEIDAEWSKEAATLLQLLLQRERDWWGRYCTAQVSPRCPCCRDKTHQSDSNHVPYFVPSSVCNILDVPMFVCCMSESAPGRSAAPITTHTSVKLLTHLFKFNWNSKSKKLVC